ncbi:DUF192 domain-containing protein [Bacillus salacetis]|uniref:DUF192 domain-containing protein n=1 Tax=Bacillus salacetis TaxID=2315464 RepID=UPI003B9F8768
MKNTVKDTLYRTIPYSISTADTFFSRLKGLMFRKDPLVEEGLLITPCNSIHMCFMKFSIDVVFLDNNNRIVKLVSSIQPWKFISPVKDSHSVLELPAGSIAALQLAEGEIIRL